MLLSFPIRETCLSMSFFIWCLVLFCLSFLFCYNMMGVRDLLYHRLWWVWVTCHTVSLFFWRRNMMGVKDLSYCRVWWLWETCHTMSFFFLRWVPFFLILCTGLSSYIPSYYFQSRLCIYIYQQAWSFSSTHMWLINLLSACFFNSFNLA